MAAGMLYEICYCKSKFTTEVNDQYIWEIERLQAQEILLCHSRSAFRFLGVKVVATGMSMACHYHGYRHPNVGRS